MSTKPFEFEKALKELEEITAWFESADVDLDQGLAKFERGMELSAQLKEHLQGVENRVEKIKQRFSGTAARGEARSEIEDEPPREPELDGDLDTPAGLF